MQNFGRALSTFAAAACGVFCVHCSHPWDDYDPRISESSLATGTGGNAGTGGMGGAGGTGEVSSSSSANVSSSTSSSSSSSGSPAETLTFTATVAECISPTTFNPDQCEFSTGVGQMSVDTSDSATLLPVHSFVRFDIDGSIANKTIDTVTLRLEVTSAMKASSDQSGEIWQVEPFTKSTLTMTEPAKMGGGTIGANKGPVTQNMVVDWTLPVALVSPNKSVFLGIFPLSSDGVNYYNADGMTPPRLIVLYH